MASSVPTGNGLLHGQAAIVTGGGQGIGLSIATAFLEQGAMVLVADLDGDKVAAVAAALGADGAPIKAVQCDVTSERDQATMVETCLSSFGRLDTLVNNAGVTKDRYIGKMSLDDFDLVLSVSLRGAWLGTRAVSGLFREQRSGSIINMSSLSGKIGNPGQTNYSAAKAGLIGLTKASAKEFGSYDVRVNAVQPGLIRTDMTLAMKPEIFAAKEAEVPLGRAGLPSEVASVVTFLASPLASYVTGAVLEVSGGRGI